ncbi:MAG: PmoA family protein [Lewinella sp.]|nr:PmoA family protein [Lewinella sp.]
MKPSFLILPLFFMSCGIAGQGQPSVTLESDGKEKKVDILIDGQLFTSYRFDDQRKKPVLWPVLSPEGHEITRSYPLKAKAGERVDHPHHVGIWLNYGDVNGLDFWNNSDAIKPERAAHYGSIHHQKLTKLKSGKGQGTLSVTAVWKAPAGNTLLDEATTYTFTAKEQVRIIDRTTTLTAGADTVHFTDNKEGMFGIRVARELELPNDKAIKLSDGKGGIVEVEKPDNSKVTGDYLSSENITGEEVWGTRAKWMKLFGEIEGEPVAIVIYDHPDNVGYPTYWHARGYGLFAANTLGQKAMSKGENELNFKLDPGQSTTFKYRVAIFSGKVTKEEIESLATFN